MSSGPRFPRPNPTREPAPPQGDRCPQCGSELDFRSDAMGYGVTVEQCTNPACRHWRTLETIRRPADAPAPRSSPRSAAGSSRRPGSSPFVATNTRRGHLQAAILAALPTTAADAVRASVVADRIGRDKHVVSVRCRQLAQAGVIASRKLSPGLRAPWLFWREEGR